MPLKTAMILAAGRGERLRPLTNHTPKPLVQVGSRTLIDHHLLALERAGFSRVVINLAHLAARIKDHLDADNYSIEIRFCHEPEGALETAGGIANALGKIDDEQLLVINGDIRTDADFSQLQLPAESDMHLWLVANPAHHPQGDFGLNRDTTPYRLLCRQPARQSWTYSGIGAFRTALFYDLPADRYPLGLLINQCITADRASAAVFRGRWFDIGTAERLRQAVRAEAGDHEP